MKHYIPFLATTLCLTLFVGCSSEDEEYTTPHMGSESTYANRGNSTTSSSNSSTSNTVTATYSYTEDQIALLEAAKIPTSTAKTIALRHAGVSESAIEGYSCVPQNYNGSLIYEITFWSGVIEYFFSISGADGSVVSFTNQFHQSGYQPSEELPEEETEEVEEEIPFEAAAGNLSLEQAKSVVFTHAGISERETSGFTINETSSGTIKQYEITFHTSESEYYYTILAASGIVTLSKVNHIVPETPEPEETPATNDVLAGTTPNVTTPTPTTTTPTTTTPTTTTPTTTTPTTTTPTTTTPTTTAPSPTVPDVPTVEETPTIEEESPTTSVPSVQEDLSSLTTSVPTDYAPSKPQLSVYDAKNAVLFHGNFTESAIAPMSVTEIKDNTGAITQYRVTFYNNAVYYSYLVNANTGFVSVG